MGVSEVWATQDLPLLVAIYERLDAVEPPGSPIRTNVLFDELNPIRDQDGRNALIRSIGRLVTGGYIRIPGNAPKPDPFFVVGVTESGLRAVGAWPSDTQPPLVLLVQLLEQQAADMEEAEPERAGRLRQAARALGAATADVGKGAVAAFLSEILRRAATGTL